jgi:hypothetical protein
VRDGAVLIPAVPALHVLHVCTNHKYLIIRQAGQHLKGISQTGKDRRLFATDGFPLGAEDLVHAVTNDIIVVSMGEAFIPMQRVGGEVGRKKLKAQGGQVYSADSGYSEREPLGIKFRPPGWDNPVVVPQSSVADAFGNRTDRDSYMPQLKISGLDPAKGRVLVLEANALEDMDDWADCLGRALSTVAGGDGAADSAAAARRERLGRMPGPEEGVVWEVGDVVDVETEDGMERGAVVLVRGRFPHRSV